MSDGSDLALEPSRSAIGPYEIVKVVGRGATGTVYSARKEGSAGEVAIKVLRSGASDEAYDRFAREISIARRLVHRHIVRVVDSGEDDDAPFLVMEVLRGQSLRELLRQGHPTLDLATRIDIVAQLCTGLHYAHEHGLVHRDVKPANVFLTDEGVVKILDFGVAKLTDTTMTADGSLIGTLAYMAPEQFDAQGQIDGRADVFSAAVVLYELVTGRKPFEADSPAAMVARIVNDDPAPVEGMPELDLVLRRALHKDPSRRFATAQDFAHALWRMLLAPRFVPLTGSVLPLPEAVSDPMSPSEPISQGTITVAVGPRPKNPQIWMYSAVAAGIVGVAVIGALMWNGSAGTTTASETGSPGAGPTVSATVTPPVPPSSVVILVASTPPKATITSAGKDIGETPAEVSVTVGQELRFRLAGYETSTILVDAASVSAKRLSVALAPLPGAR